MTNFGWRYPAAFTPLLDAPTHCQHDIPVNEPCRKCDGDWNHDGCEHNRPCPVIYYNQKGNPTTQPAEEYGHNGTFPNPNCDECRAQAEHNLKCYGTVAGFRNRPPLVWAGGGFLIPARSGR